MRQVKPFDTADGTRYRVRYRRGGTETSETFRRKADAEMFAGILGDGRDGRVAEAMAWLAAKQNERDTATFAEFFEHYVDDLTGVTKRTREDYRAQKRRYLSELDDVPLPLITRSHVTRIVNGLEADGKAPKTIKNVIHMLSSCMALAVDEEIIPRNPCRRVRLPKQAAVVDGDAEPRFLTHEEFGRLVEAMTPHYRPLVVFMVGTGLRWSEATALQSRHIDLAAGTVAVRQAWKRQAGGQVLGPPKSAKSRRTVNPATMALAAAAPLLGKPEEFVFTTPTSKVIRHGNFYNRVWVPACEAAGLHPRPSPHDLRHTHASWLLSDGRPIEAVQDQLGHESSETTRRIYAHLLPAIGVEVGRSASEALARALPNAVQIGLDVRAIEAARDADQP